MKDLEFTCTQKNGRYMDGWDHPESMEEATDQFGNLYSCCEGDCSTDTCAPCGCDRCDTEEEEENCSCGMPDCGSDEDFAHGNLVCSIFEKTCSCDESKGPDNVNDETGWHRSCTTTVRIVRKFERTK